ncbi:MAG: RNA polymerase sigma factor [Chloroflexi bacterium]|nr:RNA polymerase sigma factor [Chloroflexota bacterium]
MHNELVERARTGDHDAFSVLVRAAGPRLLGAARLILRDTDRAEDAVQEALFLAWRNVRALRDPGAWDAWLYRLTIRACYHAAKSANRRAVVELHVVSPLETGADPDFSTLVVERDRVGRAIGRLPVDQRMVMVLHFYLDLPLTDAADILEIPVGTVKSRLHRGLETLRTTMAREGDVPSGAEERPA